MGSVLEFLFITVGLKMIFGHWLAQRIIDTLEWVASLSPRRNAIWKHYQDKAAGFGHQNDDVTTCGEDKCAVFAV